MENKKVALVTGASGIIGPGICSTLRKAGWIVAAADRTLEEFEQTARYRGPVDADDFFEADLSDGPSVECLVAEVEERLGSLSLLVNNAAVGQLFDGIGNVKRSDYERLISVNLLAPFFLTQAALPSLQKNSGSVVMISSVLAEMPKPNSTLYGVSKSALEKQTEFLAHDLIKQGVRVNAIRVGCVRGGAFLREHLKDLPPEESQKIYEEVMKVHLADVVGEGEIPLVGRPEDVGNAVRFLSSPEARMVNGCALPVDSGFAYRENERQLLSKRTEQSSEMVAKLLNRNQDGASVIR